MGQQEVQDRVTLFGGKCGDGVRRIVSLGGRRQNGGGGVDVRWDVGSRDGEGRTGSPLIRSEEADEPEPAEFVFMGGEVGPGTLLHRLKVWPLADSLAVKHQPVDERHSGSPPAGPGRFALAVE